MKARLIVLILGICLVGASLLLSAVTERRALPGRLVPLAAKITWNSPPPDNLSRDRGPEPFLLRNIGGTSVRILSVESGCGCTDARAEPELVHPGEQYR